jgi:hypothetical protein
MDFEPYPNGQLALFFFQYTAGQWTIIEGGAPFAPKACATIPEEIQKQLGLGCDGPWKSQSPPSSFDPNSPEGVVSGILSAELQGDWNYACSLLQPSVQVFCMLWRATRPPAQPAAFRSGDLSFRAHGRLVSVTGIMTFPGQGGGGGTNQDPTQGMPPAAGTFDQAWTTSVTSRRWSPAPCVNIGGQWYVYVSL